MTSLDNIKDPWEGEAGTIVTDRPSPEEDEETENRRAEIGRKLAQQARERLLKRGVSFTTKKGKIGKVIGTWLTAADLDILGELSVAWEMSRTKVLTQLIRQAKGTKLTVRYGHPEGKEEKRDIFAGYTEGFEVKSNV